MKQLTIMLKPASSLCNLRCRYCFYADVAKLREIPSFGVMSVEDMRRLTENVRSALGKGDRVTFAFQGGEPTMAGLDFFRAFIAVTNAWEGIRVNYALQTNATLLDDEWCAFLKGNKFLVGVSWDILPDCHDAARVDAAGHGTSKTVTEKLALLQKWGVEYNILCTLTSAVARHPAQVWKQLDKYGVRYVQFTPCLDELETPGASPYAIRPERFFSFYDRLFRLWYADLQQGKYRSVKLFDDVVNLLAHGVPSSCGINGFCQPQLVVESNGNLYPCDFYCVDEYLAGNLIAQPLEEIFQSPVFRAFAAREHRQPKLCATCEFKGFCGGNCKRMQRQICCDVDDDFCGYRSFLAAHKQEFARLASRQR